MTDSKPTPNQASAKGKIRHLLVAALLLLIAAGSFVATWKFKKSPGSSRGPRLAFESKSPAGHGSAINVLTHHWDGPFVTLFVRDPETNGGNPVLITALLEGNEFEFLTWSGDGSLVAASVPVPGVLRPPGLAHSNSLLGFAYDFKAHCTISAPMKPVEIDAHTTRITRPSAEEQDAFIQAAMATRGGMGQPIRNMDRRRLEEWEADQFGR